LLYKKTEGHDFGIYFGPGPPCRCFLIASMHEKKTEGHDFGIVWGQKKLADLDLADDLALLCHTQQALQDMTNSIVVINVYKRFLFLDKKRVY